MLQPFSNLYMHMCVHKIFLSIVESELIIFISGPVVVSPAATIHFQADISNQNFLNGKWWKIKKGSTIEIEFNSSKYFSYQKNDIQIHEMEIIQAEEDDSAKYQFLHVSDNVQSNMITTFVDGKTFQMVKEFQVHIYSIYGGCYLLLL